VKLPAAGIMSLILWLQHSSILKLWAADDSRGASEGADNCSPCRHREHIFYFESSVIMMDTESPLQTTTSPPAGMVGIAPTSINYGNVVTPGQFPSSQHPVEVSQTKKQTEEINCCEHEKRNNGLIYAALAILIPIGALVLALSPKECPSGCTESTCIVLGDGSFPCNCESDNECTDKKPVPAALAIGIILIVFGGLGIMILPCVRCCQNKPPCCC
jgi:hypothetical protein